MGKNRRNDRTENVGGFGIINAISNLVGHINSRWLQLALSKIIKSTGEFPKHARFVWDTSAFILLKQHILPNMDVIFDLTSLKFC